ncbi:MAG: type I methionyl aminopeptidase [Flavobacteriales bacterium]|jgi:methionyl aminopeptidase|nr:type I methionyl aminopeptidase [Flavobacteriales bacterium]
MIYYKTKEEIEIQRESCLLVGKTLAEVAKLIQPGVTTAYLDKIAEEFIRDNGAVPGFKGLYDCPSTLLTSVNDAVVHGLPSDKPLEDGDIVSVDCGVLMNEFYGDSAYTFEIGEVSQEIKKLLEVTKESLTFAIQNAVAGKRIGDIGYAVQSHAEANGYGVVREMVGHGLGKKLHEKPEVPNYGRRGKGLLLKEGLVIAIEPMINMGTKDIRQDKDGWTIRTKDGKPSAHFEHDVVVMKGKADVLSTFDYIEEVLNNK